MPSVPLISSNLPRLSYHWYFCTKDLLAVDGSLKNSFVWGNNQNCRRLISYRQNVFKHEWNMRMVLLKEGENQWCLPSKKMCQVLSFPYVVQFCSLLLCSQNVLYLSVTIKESLFIETDHWICFSGYSWPSIYLWRNKRCRKKPKRASREGIFKIECGYWESKRNYFENPKSSLSSTQFQVNTNVNLLWIVETCTSLHL